MGSHLDSGLRIPPLPFMDQSRLLLRRIKWTLPLATTWAALLEGLVSVGLLFQFREGWLIGWLCNRYVIVMYPSLSNVCQTRWHCRITRQFPTISFTPMTSKLQVLSHLVVIMQVYERKMLFLIIKMVKQQQYHVHVPVEPSPLLPPSLPPLSSLICETEYLWGFSVNLFLAGSCRSPGAQNGK